MKILSEFVDQYKSAVEVYIDYLWNNNLSCGKYVLDVSAGLYNCPSMFHWKVSPAGTSLTARALTCASGQACSIVNSVLKKRKKDENKLEWKKKNNIKDEKLQKKLLNKPTKPDLKNFSCEIDSKVSSIMKGDNSFNFWLNLHCFTTTKKAFKVNFPIKNFERALFWQSEGKILNGISINKNQVTLRYEVPDIEKKTKGSTIAIDQGLTSVLTTSRDDVFPDDPHGHTLSSILMKMSKCRFGSKGFKRAVEHRKNHVNWIVKKLDLSNVKELKLEKITNINFGRNTSRLMRHWSNPLIMGSLIKYCEEQGVLVTHVKNEFNSQRCNCCGWTQKVNRKGKLFLCKQCQHTDDADANASKNILIRHLLVELPFGFRTLKKNKDGFFWTEFCLTDKFGEDLRVPQITKTIDVNHTN